MSNRLEWLSEHKFGVHLAAFLLMILLPVGMYMAAQRDATNWIWALLGLIVAGNFLTIATR